MHDRRWELLLFAGCIRTLDNDEHSIRERVMSGGESDRGIVVTYSRVGSSGGKGVSRWMMIITTQLLYSATYYEQAAVCMQ